jgi:hypothetical protein
MSHWLYKNEVFSPDYENIDWAGFVYIITNKLTGQKYIGRKRFHKKRTLKPLKGYKRRRIKISESDWRTYGSSCKELLEDIEKLGEENFEFRILSFHENYSELNYAETKLQFLFKVLEEKDKAGNWQFYNNNIENTYYKSDMYNEERSLLTEKYK